MNLSSKTKFAQACRGASARLSRWLIPPNPRDDLETGNSNFTYIELERILDSHADVAGAYETLLSGLEISERERPLRRLLVTSAQPSEGKTTVSVSLALTMARAGLDVALVDGDLRRPSLHRIMAVDNEIGTGDVLCRRAELRSVTRTVTGRNQSIALVTSGPASPDAIHSLSRLPAILATAQIAKDFVLVDSPPVLSANDAAVLAGGLDGVLFVIRAGEVMRSDVQSAGQRIQLAGGFIVGCVLNAFVQDYGAPYHPYAYYKDPDQL